MLFQIVLVVLRCSKLVTVVGNCSALFQDAMRGFGLLYDDPSCSRCVEVVFGVFCGFRL